MHLDQAKHLREMERECSFEDVDSKASIGHFPIEVSGLGRLVNPARRPNVVERVRRLLGVSELRACWVLGQA